MVQPDFYIPYSDFSVPWFSKAILRQAGYSLISDFLLYKGDIQ